MMKKKIIILALLFVGLTIHAQTTYYIDPVGSDATGNGTIGNPWKSLYKACATVRTSGNIVHVNAGTYTETVQSVLAVGVSIEGAGEASVIRTHIAGSENNPKPTILLYSGSQGTNGNQHISNIKIDGDNLQGYSGIWIENRSNVDIYNCWFTNIKWRAVYYINGSCDPPTTWAVGNSFYNNYVSNCSGYYAVGTPIRYNGDGRGALNINGQEGFRCYNNTMVQTDRGAGVYNGYLIKGVCGYNRDLKIYDNILSRTSWDGLTWYFAIELWMQRGGIEIYNNKITNGAIDLSGGSGEIGLSTIKGNYAYGAWIHDNDVFWKNHSYDALSKGILVEGGAESVIIERNHITKAGTGIYFPLYPKDDGTGKAFNDIRISYNIVEDIGTATDGDDTYLGDGYGILMPFSPVLTTGWVCDNVAIWNNVITAHVNNRTPTYGIILPVMGTTTNISVRNNIVQGFATTAIYGKGASGVTLDYLSIENNIFNGNGSNSVGYSGLTPTHNTTQNNLTSNPLFVSSTDFHLQSSSPAHTNPGLDVGLTLDFDSVTVVSPPDRGAFEFTGNHPPSIQNQDFQLNENIPNGTDVGTAVASDLDAGQTLTYSLVSGNTGGAFAINDSTGMLSVANGAALKLDFALVVKVQDNGVGELSSQAIVAINIIPTGIELTGNEGTIKVYPNPVFDELIIEMKGNNDRLSFDILNSINQIVFKGNLSDDKTVVQTINFSPGVYLIKIENLGAFEFKKIVKV